MTEQWKSTAAERFNEKIRMSPQDELDRPTVPIPERKPETWIDVGEMIYENNVRLFKVIVDSIKLRRVG